MKMFQIKKSTIAASVIIAIASPIVSADENVIVVTANRVAQDINDILADVEVIEREEIERIQPQSLIELLANISGVDSVQKGGHGQDASIFLRGTNSNQVLVLIDGVKVGSATLGVKSVSNISIAQIERVEIVKGPRAALWGSDAIGGVIQIFTRRLTTGEHKVALTLGSNSAREVDAAIGFGNEVVNNTLSYSRKETDGFDARIDDEIDKDGYENDSLAIRGNYNISDNSVLDWVAQVDQGESEFDTSWGGNIAEHQNHLWNLRFNHESGDWSHQVAIRNSRDQSVTFGNGISRSEASVFETRRQQFSLLTRNNISETISLSGGLEWLEDDIEKSTTEYNEEKRAIKSAHLGLNYGDQKWIFDLATRYGDVENIASESTYNIALGYKVNPQNLISLNFSEGFKAPTFNDLYFPFGGNSELQSETSDNTEIVYKHFFNNGNLVVSLYDSEIENLIQWIPDSEGIWSPQNVGSAEISGIDMNYSLRHDDFSHQFNASYTDAEDATNGKQLLRRAKQHFSYEVSHVMESFDWFAQFQYVGKRADQDFQSFLPINLDSYTRINIGIGYSFNNQWQLKFKINDLFDEAPTSVSGYNPVEREIYLTISHQNLF